MKKIIFSSGESPLYRSADVLLLQSWFDPRRTDGTVYCHQNYCHWHCAWLQQQAKGVRQQEPVQSPTCCCCVLNFNYSYPLDFKASSTKRVARLEYTFIHTSYILVVRFFVCLFNWGTGFGKKKEKTEHTWTLRTANYKEQGRYSPNCFRNCFRKLRQTSSNCPGNLKRQDLPEAGYSCCCCSSWMSSNLTLMSDNIG